MNNTLTLSSEPSFSLKDETFQELSQSFSPSFSLQSMEMKELLSYPFKKREAILSPWLFTQSLSMIYAPRGVGKTHVSLGIAYAVASGTSFLGWEVLKPRGVLFIDGEMAGCDLQERMMKIKEALGKETITPLHFITPELQSMGMPNLASLEGQKALESHITEETELIILDNLSTLVQSGRENEAESWQPVQAWALSLRARGKSVLFIHHSGKNGQQRGTSRREDVLDTVISLNRPQDYQPHQGACFEVHFEKSRFLWGETVKPFRAELLLNEEQKLLWHCQKLDDTTFDKVSALLEQGWQQKEIAKALQLHKGTVSKYVSAIKRQQTSSNIKELPINIP